MFRKQILFKLMVLVACAVPVLLLFILSFTVNWRFPDLFPKSLTTSNWTDLLTGNSNTQSLLLSLAIAISIAILATMAGFVTSQWIAYHPNKKQLLLLTYLPFVVSPVILAVCLKFYFIKMNLAGTVAGVVLAQLIIAFPYSTIFFTGFWNRRIQQYQSLVSTLGGSSAFAFRKVILPMAKPMLLVCFFQTFLISWFEYGLTSVIGYGKVQTLTIKVYQFVTEANIFYAALSCCLLILPPVIFLWLNKKFIFRQGEGSE